MKKILLSTMLSLFFAISSFAQFSGYCGGEGDGTNLTWSLSDNVLTISGTGRMAGYDSSNGVPWRIYRQSIERVVIGNSVTSIGGYAFYYCSSLTSITVNWEMPIVSGFAFSDIAKNATLVVPVGAKANYEVADYWKDFGTIMEREGGTSANGLLPLGDVSVSYVGGVLSVDSPRAEILRVYSLTGALVYTATKGEGRAIFAVNMPSGVYVVTGSDGWSVKVVGYSVGR